MRYLALACDYDGTLARDGRVDRPTLAALERVRASGRKLLLVTGRELDDLAATFEYLELFHNRQRRHSSLGMLTPFEFEARQGAPATSTVA